MGRGCELGGSNGAVVQTCLAGLAWIGGGSSLAKGKYKDQLASAQQFVLRGLDAPDRMGDTGGANWNQTTWGYAHAAIFLGELAIASGKKADIVFLDLGSINWIPHNWSVNQVVHAEDGNGVRHVMIGGRFVVRDRRLLTLDLAKLAVEAEAARDRLEGLNAEFKELYDRLEPVVASFCPAFAARPYHIRQYLCDAPA